MTITSLYKSNDNMLKYHCNDREAQSCLALKSNWIVFWYIFIGETGERSDRP